jgi:NH3-dependent NAD+ synthetase
MSLTAVRHFFEAELRPVAENAETEEHSQVDEVEMGMTYQELGVFG